MRIRSLSPAIGAASAFLLVVSLTSTMAETFEEYTTMSKWERVMFSGVAQNCFDDVHRLCHHHAALATSGASNDDEGRRTVEENGAENVPSANAVTLRREIQPPPPQQHDVIFHHSPFFVSDFHRQALDEFDLFVNHVLRPHHQSSEWLVVFDTSSNSGASSSSSFNKPPCRKRLDLQQQLELAAQQQHQHQAEDRPQRAASATTTSAATTATTVRNAARVVARAEPMVENGQSDPASSVHHLIRTISGMVPVSELDHVAKKLQKHGNELLTSDKIGLTETGRRMARRLSEVSADELIEQHKELFFLPFSASDNQCLLNLYREHGPLETKCEQSMQRLEYLRVKEFELQTQLRRDDQEVYSYLTILYLFGFGAAILYAIRSRRQMKRNMQLLERVVISVYANPALKRQVELKMGQSAGYVPPLPKFVLARRGLLGAEFAKRLDRVRLYAVLLLTTMFMIGFVWGPLPMLQVAAFLSVVHCVRAALVVGRSGTKHRGDDACVLHGDPICTCCCCGMTTENYKNGVEATKEQACCGCCQGTGVCSVQCASCCGPKKNDEDDDEDGAAAGCCCMGTATTTDRSADDGCCCCCGDDCCCAKDSDNKMKTAPAECSITKVKYVYDGSSPIQVV